MHNCTCPTISSIAVPTTPNHSISRCGRVGNATNLLRKRLPYGNSPLITHYILYANSRCKGGQQRGELSIPSGRARTHNVTTTKSYNKTIRTNVLSLTELRELKFTSKPTLALGCVLATRKMPNRINFHAPHLDQPFVSVKGKKSSVSLRAFG